MKAAAQFTSLLSLISEHEFQGLLRMPSNELSPEPPPVATAPHRDQHIRQAKILIADEQRRDVYQIKSFLQQDGFHSLFTARTGAEAIPLAIEVSPDLILLDIGMPDCGSLETLRVLRSQPSLAAIPVVMMVGELTSDAKLGVLQCGAIDLLQKPLHQAELLGRTRNVLAAKITQDRLNRHFEHLEETIRAEPRRSSWLGARSSTAWLEPPSFATTIPATTFFASGGMHA